MGVAHTLPGWGTARGEHVLPRVRSNRPLRGFGPIHPVAVSLPQDVIRENGPFNAIVMEHGQ